MSEKLQAKLHTLTKYSDELKALTNKYKERGAQLLDDSSVETRTLGVSTANADQADLIYLRNRVAELEREIAQRPKTQASAGVTAEADAALALEEAVHATEAENRMLRNNIANLEARLHEANLMLHEAQHSMQVFDIEIQSRDNNLRSTELRCQQLQSALDAKEKELEVMRDLQGEYNANIHFHMQEMDKMKHQMEALEGSSTKGDPNGVQIGASHELVKLQAQLQEATAQLSARDAEIAHLKMKGDRAAGDSYAAEQVRTLVEEVERLERALEHKSEELNFHVQNNTSTWTDREMAAYVEHIRNRADDSEREVARVNRDMCSLRSKVASEQLETQRIQVTTKLNIKNAEEEAQHYRRRLEEAEKERGYQVDDLRQQLAMAEADEKRLREEMLVLTEQFNSRIVEMEVNYHALLSQNQNLTSQANRLKTELEVEQERRHAEEEEKRRALRQLEAKLSESNTQQAPGDDLNEVQKSRDRDQELRIAELEDQLQSAQRRLASSMESEAIAKEQLESSRQLKTVLDNDIKHLKSQVSRITVEAEANHQSLQNQVKHQQDEYDDLHQRFQELQSQKTKQFTEYQDKLKEMQETLLQMTLQDDNTRHSLDQERARVADLQTATNELEGENDRLRTEYYQTEAELAATRRRLQDLETEATHALVERASTFEEQKGEMLTVCERLQSQVQQAEAQILELKQERAELQATLKAKTKENEDFSRQVEDYMKQLQAAQDTQWKISNDMQTMTDNYTKLRKEKEDGDFDHRSQLQSIREQLSVAEVQNKSLKRDIVSMQHQINQLKATNQTDRVTWEQTLAAQKNLGDNNRQEIEQLTANLRTTNQQLREREAAYNDLALKHREEVRHQERIQQEADRLEGITRQQKIQIGKLEDEMRQAKEEKEEASNRINDLEDRMSLLQNSLTRIQNENLSLEDLKVHAEVKIQEYQTRIHRLETEKESLEKTIRAERDVTESGVEKLVAEMEGLRSGLHETERIEKTLDMALKTEKEEKAQLYEAIQSIAFEVEADVAHLKNPGLSRCLRVEKYPAGYTDPRGRSPADIGFMMPGYSIHYRDANGLGPGEEGFRPPACGTRCGPGGKAMLLPQPLRAGCYDENYCDGYGRRPGDKGFVPPIVPGVGDIDEKAKGLVKGYDAEYVDAKGNRPGQPGFVPPCYDGSYTDSNGLHPGDEGFIPPAHGWKSSLGGTTEAKYTPLASGCFDENYRDADGRKPGDRGFLPPTLKQKGKTAAHTAISLPDGYDAHYCDAKNLKMGDVGFIPPKPTGYYSVAACAPMSLNPGAPAILPLSLPSNHVPLIGHEGYDSTYVDATGRHASEAGFQPPEHMVDAVWVTPNPLPALGYDANYVDANGRRAGEKGFKPPGKSKPLDYGYDEDYHDADGNRPGMAAFMPPCYGLAYEDANGRRPGDSGFIPPPGKVGIGMERGTYDECYRDNSMRQPGDRGFIPPFLEGQKTSEEAAILLPEGYDDNYRDCNGRARGEPGFIPPQGNGRWCLTRYEVTWVKKSVPFYDARYRDAQGKYPGQQGFKSPSPRGLILDRGCYDAYYVDENGLKAGDKGFRPPLIGATATALVEKTRGLPTGFDAEYRDEGGRKPGLSGFVPPCYDDHYMDANGKSPGQEGFVPPSHSLTEGKPKTLGHGCYDENYRDTNGRKPGDRGFVPILDCKDGRIPSDTALSYPRGFNEYYRDSNNLAPSEDGFVPPLPTGAQTQIRAMLPGYIDDEGSSQGPQSPLKSLGLSKPDQTTIHAVPAFVDTIISQIHGLRATVSQAKSTITVLEGEKAELVDRLRSVKLEQAHIHDQLGEYQKNTELARELLQKQYEDLLRESSQVREDALEARSTFQLDLGTYKTRIAELEKSVTAITNECEELEFTVLSKEDELAHATKILSDTREEMNRLMESYNEVKAINEKQTAIIKAQNVTFEQEAAKLRQNYDRRVESTDASRNELVAQIARMQDEERSHHQQCSSEIHELSELNRQKDMCIDKLMLELTAMSDVVCDVEKQIMLVESDNQALVKMLKAAKEDFDLEAESIRDETKVLIKDKANLQRQAQAAQEQLRTEQASLLRLHEDLKTLRNQKETVETEAMNSRIQRDTLQERLRAAQAQSEEEKYLQKQTLEAQISTLQKEVDHQKNANEQQRQQIEKLIAQRRSLRDDNTVLNESMCTSKKEHEEVIKQLRFDIQRLQNEWNKAETNLQHKEAEIQQLTKRLQHQSQQIAEQETLVGVLRNEGASSVGTSGLSSTFLSATRSPLSKYTSSPSRTRPSTGFSSTGLLTPTSRLSMAEDSGRMSPSAYSRLRQTTSSSMFISPRLPGGM